MNNLSSYYGLVDAKIRASNKDLPVEVRVKITTLGEGIKNVAKKIRTSFMDAHKHNQVKSCSFYSYNVLWPYFY